MHSVRRATAFSGRHLFFDESAVILAMAHAYGRGPKGERVLGSEPKNWGDGVTVAACLTSTAVVAPFYRHCSMTRAAMDTCTGQVPSPEVRPGDLAFRSVPGSLCAAGRSLMRDDIVVHRLGGAEDHASARQLRSVSVVPA